MLKFIVKFLVFPALLLASLAVLAGALILEDNPRVTDASPPAPADVLAARSFVHGVRATLADSGAAPADLETNVDELNATMKLGGRFVRGFRGTLDTEADRVRGQASVPIQIGQATRWVNLTLEAPEFEDTFALSYAQLGPLELSPDFVLGLLRVGVNWKFGNDMGDAVLASATRMDVDGQDLAFTLTLGEVGANGIMNTVFGSLRGEDMPGAEEIGRYYVLIREEMERGGLPVTGSYLPYLLFTLEAAEAGAKDEGAANAYTSALFALTLVCGAEGFSLFGGMNAGDLDKGRTWTKSCSQLTLNDRIDSRRHFTTAAAIQAASNRGFAVSVGEFKELHDTLKSGGFDFTDISANNSGIRMSNRFMNAQVSEWAGLRRRIATENDVIIPFDGIPQIMEEDAFRARFGDIDSPAYQEQLAEIEARIDALPLHR